jgi:SAM-dependent methyltransferase
MTDSTSEAGAAVYSKNVLSIYDPFVLGFSSTFAWRSPARHTVDFYNRHVSARHLDVGVGTGYFLDHCAFPDPEPAIVLLDMNGNSLRATAERLARYSPKTHTADILEPVALGEEPFGSIGLSFLFHCLPGSFPEKSAAVFNNLKPHLAPGGTLFGTTILGSGVNPNPLARLLMGIYNNKGIFSNTADTLSGLEKALEASFPAYTLEQNGLVAFFTAIPH